VAVGITAPRQRRRVSWQMHPGRAPLWLRAAGSVLGVADEEPVSRHLRTRPRWTKGLRRPTTVSGGRRRGVGVAPPARPDRLTPGMRVIVPSPSAWGCGPSVSPSVHDVSRIGPDRVPRSLIHAPIPHQFPYQTMWTRDRQSAGRAAQPPVRGNLVRDAAPIRAEGKSVTRLPWSSSSTCGPSSRWTKRCGSKISRNSST
jgi:hypothetical protein